MQICMDDNAREDQGQFTIKLHDWQAGNTDAGKEVIEMAYQRLVSIATQAHRKIQGLSINPHEVVHESYQRIQSAVQLNPPKDRVAFFNLANQVIHNTCVDLLRKKLAFKRSPNLGTAATRKTHVSADHSLYQMLLLLEELTQLHARQAQSFKLHCVIGFTLTETAEMTEVSEATVSRDVTFSRHWLAAKLSS